MSILMRLFSKKAECPILVTLSGITILIFLFLSKVFLKAFFPIIIKLLLTSKFRLSRLLFSKTNSPILITLSGMVTFLIWLFAKAKLPILVTLLGIIILVKSLLKNA